MTRIFSLVFAALLVLQGCATGPVVGDDGRPRVGGYNPGSQSQVQFRMLDAVNALRQANGLRPVELNSRLNAAAATHSRDMAVQNRPWHFGSDGSSPLHRIRRAGYDGQLLGENISETFESELETLTAWMEQTDTRNVIMDPAARDMGLAYHRDSGGKLWWTLIMGGGSGGFGAGV